MSDEAHPHLRAVAETPAGRAKRRGPGPAVLMVFLYAGLFGAGLLWFRSKSPLLQRPRSDKDQVAAKAPPAPPSAADHRRDLISGAGLIGAAREEYLRRIATDCCSCGCDLTLERCLATEKTCPESPPRAAAILESLR